MEIDYSEVPQAPATTQSRWIPPRHVYFGPKDAETGQMLPEPHYEHQDFPCFLYKQENGKTKARIVKNADEKTALSADGWAATPAAFGVVTTPSFEQRIASEQKRSPGRPKKED